jgi:GNAT superfamily N-acetyltransferase
MTADGTAIAIERVDVSGAESLTRLAARLFVQTFGAENTPDNMRLYLASAFSPEAQSAELSDPDRAIWTAVSETGDAIGYAMLRRGTRAPGITGERPAEVQRIYADLEWHGRGVGHALMNACIAQARAWQCDELWLGVWEQNPRAIAFYEKTGFRAVGRQTFMLGRDVQHDWVMAFPLD